MKLSQNKNYYNNSTLYAFLFINTIIYTILVSLKVWHTLILAKAIILKCIILVLHRLGVFHKACYFIVTEYKIYFTYSEKGLRADGENRNEDEPSRRTEGYIVIGALSFFLVVGPGLQLLNYFYPTAIPVIQNAVTFVGVSLVANVKGLCSLFEIAEPANSPVDLEETRTRYQSVLYVNNDGVYANLVALDIGINSKNYHSMILKLCSNNVPHRLLLLQDNLGEELLTIYDKDKSLDATKPLYASGLPKLSLTLYNTFLKFDPK